MNRFVIPSKHLTRCLCLLVVSVMCAMTSMTLAVEALPSSVNVSSSTIQEPSRAATNGWVLDSVLSFTGDGTLINGQYFISIVRSKYN